MTSLYELAYEIKTTEEAMIASGMDEQTVIDTLDGLSISLEEKINGIVKWVKNNEALAAAIKQEEAAMKERRAALENRNKWLKAYVLDAMRIAGMNKIDYPEFAVTVRNNPQSVFIHDASLIPDDFMRQPPAPPPEVDKKAIAERLKEGGIVPGAELVRSKRLEIK